MTKRHLLRILLLLGLTNAFTKAQPNVLFILVDDFGIHDVGYNGSTFYETPEMDKLAEEWTRFDHCYTPSPMCSPTRASILTGKNPARHGITQWLRGTDKAYVAKGETPRVYCPGPKSGGIKASELTLGEAFQQAGYDTAFYGKWHMGALKNTGGPKAHGYAEQKAVIEANRARVFYPFGGKKGAPLYFPESKPGDNFTDLLTDEAIEFMARERKQPFYLHLCYFSMHSPIESKPVYREKFAEKAAKLPPLETDRFTDKYTHKPQKLRQDEPEYAGQLFNLDRNIGRLIQSLKQADMYDDTIIVLTGDNGGRSAFFRSPPTCNKPLRNGKTFLFEGGIRTPLLIHWPGHSKPGQTIDEPVVSMDFYPTLLEMAGLEAQAEQCQDAASLVPLFSGETIERDAMIWHFPHYQGEGSYPASAIRKGTYKLIHNYHHDDQLLYDLSVDPNEINNLADHLPKKRGSLHRELMNVLEDFDAIIPQPKK